MNELELLFVASKHIVVCSLFVCILLVGVYLFFSILECYFDHLNNPLNDVEEKNKVKEDSHHEH